MHFHTVHGVLKARILKQFAIIFTSDEDPRWELTVAQIMNSLFAKFRLQLKKVVKTTRPFRYDLNQIHYDSTMKVINRFTGLGFLDRVPEELLWMEVRDIVQETVIKTIPPPHKKCKKAKWLSKEALTNS